jgi:hypothetical protein
MRDGIPKYLTPSELFQKYERDQERFTRATAEQVMQLFEGASFYPRFPELIDAARYAIEPKGNKQSEIVRLQRFFATGVVVDVYDDEAKATIDYFTRLTNITPSHQRVGKIAWLGEDELLLKEMRGDDIYSDFTHNTRIAYHHLFQYRLYKAGVQLAALSFSSITCSGIYLPDASPVRVLSPVRILSPDGVDDVIVTTLTDGLMDHDFFEQPSRPIPLPIEKKLASFFQAETRLSISLHAQFENASNN